MEAMILAAGLGTRLRPLTNHTPKALVPVGGTPMLAHVARRLVAAGADRLVVNVHAHADQVQAYLDAHDFGATVCVSEEPEERLETGGGLKHAAGCFRKDGPFWMHNADVFTDLDLEALRDAHVASGALATLAVREATTDRYLVFDGDGVLCGYAYGGEEKLVREPGPSAQRFDFCGVQVLHPRIFDLMTETGVFSIISVYLRLVQAGERVDCFDVGDARWIDIGTPERLEEARTVFADWMD